MTTLRQQAEEAARDVERGTKFGLTMSAAGAASLSALLLHLAEALPEWRPISTRPDADDEMWFGKFDGTGAFVVDGPRGSSFDDADWWQFWSPCEAPTPPIRTEEKE